MQMIDTSYNKSKMINFSCAGFLQPKICINRGPLKKDKVVPYLYKYKEPPVIMDKGGPHDRRTHTYKQSSTKLVLLY